MQENPLELLPDINFDPRSTDEILTEMITDYESEYELQTGEKTSLPLSSRERIFINTQAARFAAAYQLIDRGCKMNLLKYSEGKYLDNLAALLGIQRLPAQRSVATVEFTLSAPQPKAVTIPKGTRVSTASNVFFETTETAVILPGERTATCPIQSLGTGIQTAGFLPGQIATLVDPVAYVAFVSNTETTQGGSDVEDDERLRLRVYYCLRARSTAGPEDAYIYFVQAFSQSIECVSCRTPQPGEVDIRITLTGGELPNTAFIDKLQEYLIPYRPLTDSVYIGPPELVDYAVDCTFYIARSDIQRQEQITKAVDESVKQYVSWQSGRIGRDIVPDRLINLAVAAGAKRLEIRQPVFTLVAKDAIGLCAAAELVPGGVEDD